MRLCSQTGKKIANFGCVSALLEVRTLRHGWYPAFTPSRRRPTEITDRRCTTTSFCLNTIEHTCTRTVTARATSTAANTRAQEIKRIPLEPKLIE